MKTEPATRIQHFSFRSTTAFVTTAAPSRASTSGRRQQQQFFALLDEYDDVSASGQGVIPRGECDSDDPSGNVVGFWTMAGRTGATTAKGASM
ncbi:uncharacterized protein IUM83_08490 [Phytophthora cinnamomi]|uniref:uncharacterized protein n=1 Tax=Phytophthora cinnamomi TaxID=4785 RepID=UPI00355A66B4|nr:hypothetical protein IUM83_08490 [Phytophthora cinnamomi]